MPVLAVQAIQKMRGGSQSQLMLGADSNFWVVKFQNNPQHIRVLANDLIASRLGQAIGLDFPLTDVIDVVPWLVDGTSHLEMEPRQGRREKCRPGLQFGSRYVGFKNGVITHEKLIEYLPVEHLDKVRNVDQFAGVLALDKWTCNCDGRQAVYSRRARERKYKATFIDQGFCFNAGDWNFPDSPLRGVYGQNCVYAGVTGWNSFEPWLGRIESLPSETLWAIAEAVPPEWYGGDLAVIERLMEKLLQRRFRVRELILSFRDSDRAPFPLWARTASIAVPACSTGSVAAGVL